MGFTVVDWSTLSEITSAKLKAMMDNDQYLKDTMSQGIAKVGFSQKTSNQTGISTATIISGISVTTTTVASHFYRLTFSYRSLNTTSGPGIYGVQIKEDGNLKMESNVNIVADGLGMSGNTVVTIVSPSAGSHTYTVVIDRKTGTGTATLNCDSTYPATLIVEDVGT